MSTFSEIAIFNHVKDERKHEFVLINGNVYVRYFNEDDNPDDVKIGDLDEIFFHYVSNREAYLAFLELF